MSTDGASASNNSNMIVKAMAATSATADGLELWISVCNTLGSACNNPQNGVFVCVCVFVHVSASICVRICVCTCIRTCIYFLMNG